MYGNIMVKNREGDLVPLDISKFREKIEVAISGIQGVTLEEVEENATIQFYSGIPTSKIQESLIRTLVDMIDVDRPQMTFAAARAFLEDLYHKVGKKFKGKKGDPYSHSLRTYLNYGAKIGRINPSFYKKFSEKELKDLDDYIDPSRDMQFTYLGIKVFYDRYILKDLDGEPFELPQHLFMAVAMFLAQNEEDRVFWSKKFYDLLSKFEFMSATPTISNARTNRNQLSSCFQGVADDSIEGIFDSYKNMALLSKYGGGIGWDWTNVRAEASSIDGHKGAGGGIVPWLKITNDIAIAVDQLGTRKGAIAVYVEPWHMDIEDFLDLKKNSGEERRRAHDLFPALWIPDIFMKRVEEDGYWTLFDPADTPDLHDLTGEEFDKKYKKYEQEDGIRKERVKAKDLWKKILLSYFETGLPFLAFKDNANMRHMVPNEGVIYASNLCTEIFQSSKPAKYGILVKFEDGTTKIFKDQMEEVIVRAGSDEDFYVKPAKKLNSVDEVLIEEAGEKIYKRVVFAKREKIEEEKIVVCNLGSINLSKVNTKEKIKEVVPIAIRMLDNVIDLNFYPVEGSMLNNKRSRAIGLGIMGEAQMLAEKKVHFGSQEHLELIDEIMENISYEAIKASMILAQERGACKAFYGSEWEKGVMPFDSSKEEARVLTKRKPSNNWEELRESIKKHGIRNAYLMAVAPTSSISIICGTTQAIEPVYKRKWMEENISGLIPVTAPNISPETWQYYTPFNEVDPINIIKAAAVRQKWIDQGQSVNIKVKPNEVTGSKLHAIYSTAWKLGLKSTYYLRSESPEVDETIDRSIECEGCQ